MAIGGLDKQKLEELQTFVKHVEQNPEVLQAPELAFFRSFIERQVNASRNKSGTRPSASQKNHPSPNCNVGEEKSTSHKKPDDYDMPISEDEVDTADETDATNLQQEDEDPGRMAPETEPLPPLGNPNAPELTEDQMEEMASLKEKVSEALEDKRYAEALSLMNKVLQMGPPSALSYARRAEINLRLKRPKACIQDCTEAVRLNPDNGKAYRLRGRAYRALGEWEKAHEDLELGQKIDYDDDVYDEQKFVAAKWKAIDEKRRARERRREERACRNLLRERRRRQAAARREYEKQKATGYTSDDDDDFGGLDDESDDPAASFLKSGAGGAGGFGNMPGGPFGGAGGAGPFGGAGGAGPFGGAGGAGPFGGAGGAGPFGGAGAGGGLGNLLGGLMNNPEMKKAMQNPKVLQAVMELMQNPSAFSKYQNDPEVMAAFSSLMSSMKGNEAAPGGCCGGGKCA